MNIRNKRIKWWQDWKNRTDTEELHALKRKYGRKAWRYMCNVPILFSGYQKWIYLNEQDIYKKNSEKPLVHFHIFLYATDKKTASGCLKSLSCQTYKRFRIYFPGTRAELVAKQKEVARDFPEDYFLILDGEKESLSPNALSVMADVLQERSYDMVYSDEDRMEENGRRCDPFFKPDWSPDTFEEFFYTGNLTAYRGIFWGRLLEHSGEKSNIEGEENLRAWIYRQLHRCDWDRRTIGHIPKVLCHWKGRYPLICAEQTLEVPGQEKVSVIIPSKDHSALLEQCIRSVKKYSAWDKEGALPVKLEIIVVDNGSAPKEREIICKLSQKYDFDYLYEPMEFNFSRMCNLGAARASGDYLLFLNDDIEAAEQGWLGEMCLKASQGHVGAVGAKLYYPHSRTIQHIGVINLAEVPAHAFAKEEDDGDLYFGRNRFNYNYLAVTAACMMVRRQLFEEVGGFYTGLKVGYNDVEFCFRLWEKGYYNVNLNHIALYHHESLSRGDDRLEEGKYRRLMAEMSMLYELHPGLLGRDPFYNPNLTGYMANFDLKIDGYAEKEENQPLPPVSRVGKYRWGIRPEWISPRLKLHIDFAGLLDRAESTDLSKAGKEEILIRGWAYVEDAKNWKFARSLVLYSETGKSYKIGVYSRYRADLRERFPEVEGMEMLAFQCRFPQKMLKEGTCNEKYQIGFLAEAIDSSEIYLIFSPVRL